MPQKILFVQALYDYDRSHNDELSFKKGDILAVSQQLDGGWWEGSLNGEVGWFPSNYISPMRNSSCENVATSDCSPPLEHLRSFQDEIVQHILEGEIRQVNELSNLLSSFVVNLEPFGHLFFLNKIFHLKDSLTQAINLHRSLAAALNHMKQIVLERHLSSCGLSSQLDRCKQQLSLVFDRLGRYPLLLKEMERCLESSHVDREDIQKAMNVYGEITERCAILRKFKEYDVEILLSTIEGWQGVSIDQLGDPVLTLRVKLTDLEHSGDARTEAENRSAGLNAIGQPCVLVSFPACILLLARTKQANTYRFIMKIDLNCLTIVPCLETMSDLDLLIAAASDRVSDRKSARTGRVSLACTDQNARDLLVSTLSDLIQYQRQLKPSSRSSSGSLCSSPDPTRPNAVTMATVTTTTTPSTRTETSGASDVSGSVTAGQRRDGRGKSRSDSPKSESVSHSAQHSSKGLPSHVSNMTQPADHLDGGKRVATTPSETSDRPLPSIHSMHGIKLLPHLIQTHAHVRWFERKSSQSSDCSTDPPLPTGVLRSLRLDGPQDVMNQATASHRVHSTYMNISGPNAALSNLSGLPGATRADGSDVHVSSGRPHSPRGDASSRELRRKKSEEAERRTADAARVLQVVEAYCASAWTELACRSLEPSNRNSEIRLSSAILSPTDTGKTLLPSYTTDARQSNTAPTKASEVKAKSQSVGLRNRHSTKRSGSKKVTAATALTTDPVMTVSSSQLTPSQPLSSTGESSVVQSMSPPPVILPTRGGRRL